jgi:hypothetical protein
MDQINAAKAYSLLVGAVLIVAGVVGFFYESQFTSDESVRDAVFGVLDVNGWHNVVHIATGALGLVAFAAGAASSRAYALGLGLVYAVVAIWGFAIGDGESILSIIPVNTEDSVLHALLGVAGLGAGLAALAEPRAVTASH